jgi:hypothetical protein
MQTNENNSPLRYTANVVEILEDGSAVIELPQELLTKVGWGEGTEINIRKEENGAIILSKN